MKGKETRNLFSKILQLLLLPLMSLAFWSQVLFAAAFIVGYLLLVMAFLNDLYEKRVLFPWQTATLETTQKQAVKLFFSSDIFDLFWLVFAAIPNALFSHAYCLGVYSQLCGWKRSVFVGSFIIVPAIVYVFVCNATNDFATNDKCWAKEIANDGAVFNKYDTLEQINSFMFSIEAISVLSYIICTWFGFVQLSTAFAMRTLAASMILSVYWLMLILSRIYNRMVLGEDAKDKTLFPWRYRFLGCAAVLTVIISAHLLFSVPQEEAGTVLETYKFLLGSVIIPCVPVAIQVVQILSPKNKREA